MKGQRLICPAVRQIEIEDFEVGPLPDDSVLVENQYTAVSVGTEIYNWVHGCEPSRRATFPRTTGYCNAGTVIETGKLVTAVKPGDRVAGDSYHASHAILTAYYQKVPQEVCSKSAAFMVMGAVALHGVRVARIELGESVVVLGLGIVGQLASSLARVAGGMPIIVIDVDKFRLAKAAARGADACLDASATDDLRAAIADRCPEDGANVVIEATGKPDVYPTAVKLACSAGRVISLGSPRGTVNMDFLHEVHLREVSIIGAFQPATPQQSHRYYHWTKDRERRLILSMMRDGRLTAEDLITHVARPQQCAEIYAMLADQPRDALGVLFQW